MGEKTVVCSPVLLVLIAALPLCWCFTTNCGVYMEEGVVTSNCTGVFTIRSSDRVDLVQCGGTADNVYNAPVEVFSGDCKDILLSYRHDSGKPTEIYLFVMVPLLVLLLVLAIGLTLLYRLKVIFEVSKDGTVKFEGRSVVIEQEGSYRKLSLGFVLACLLLCRSTTAYCVPYVHAHEGTSLNLFSFDLSEGESACFDSGVVTHTENVESMELTFLYETSTWAHFVWSKKACGYGDCGSEEECSSFGSHGKLIHEDGLTYKKYCHPFDSRGFSCFWRWGCWLATNEVITMNSTRFTVQQVGSSVTKDDYTIEGLEDCSVVQETLDPTRVGKLALVTRSDGMAWLCPDFSQPRKPTAGSIGDIQWYEGKPLFDFSAFECEIAHSSSSGSCLVEEPAIPKLLSNCLPVPGPSPHGEVYLDKGELKIRSRSGRRFNIRCPKDKVLSSISHDCHSMEAVLHGVRQEGGSLYLTIKADSLNSSSVLVLNSTCGDDPIIVPCTGKLIIVKVTSQDMATCFPDLGAVQDNTKALETDSWVWEVSDHNAISLTTHMGIGASTLLVIVVVVVILLLIRK